MVGWGDDDRPLDGTTLLEATNGVAQARRLAEFIRVAVSSDESFRLNPELLCEMNDLAMRGIIPTAGAFRERSDVEITGSAHVLPPHEEVPNLVAEACDFVSANWDADATFLAAYVLWRICWVHPFEDGNGRTARAVSYIVLSVRLGLELHGQIPAHARIKYAPRAYTRALEAADAACARGELDVSELQRLLNFYLEAQLRDDPPGLPPGA